ncbi:MAG: sigma-54 dependent transcriptional regulator [Spirochaetales bacterium]|uniref:Sigma-54 dependent transcriptional regulator n=1 Tax=Candidatus Thalassospirochaeta sargassi TaxID=3119039 RepID=A0AAJ1MKJ7_9SPIO|nr:sigma-54 dependent transcriptional regulator [Spirochaetales bacterium]
MNPAVLIVDDEIKLCESLSQILKAHKIPSEYTDNPSEAVSLIKNKSYRLLISDIKMPGFSGIELLEQIKALDNKLQVIMISGYASVDTVVEAMKLGALNFYEKPIDIARFVEEIKQILMKQSHPIIPKDGKIIINDRVMMERWQMATTAAATDAPVIITGESGTGKEHFAAAVHENSRRKEKPFIKINCAALPDTLLESELFGHEKGAFTDAKSDRKGKFEVAEGGTLFFDEIGDMNLNTQAKLLRVLQEKEFERLGSNKVRSADVRFVAATHRNLEAMIEEGTFRQDLYYRLSVICLDIPPLRERKDDIIPLSDFFISLYCSRYEKPVLRLSDEVKHIFMNHSWPGNVRELKNTIERTVIFSKSSEVKREELPSQYQVMMPVEQDTFTSLHDKVDREMVLGALDKAHGNKSQAAEYLNISRKTLYAKLKKLNIEL